MFVRARSPQDLQLYSIGIKTTRREDVQPEFGERGQKNGGAQRKIKRENGKEIKYEMKKVMERERDS